MDLGKQKHHQLLRDHVLQPYWTQKHTKAFTLLKQMLTSEPVLRAPKFDGTPFILTTDGCKSGFGAVLSQRHTITLPNGEQIVTIHPVGYGSKRTSPIEERYKLYILEFAALKFGFDHFSNIIWGFHVEIETDCIALQDTLCNNKLSTVHARWQDGITPYQIADVHHRPGKSNGAADGLSRKSSGLPHEEGDGSAWSVNEDWESSKGLVNDMFTVETDSGLSSLWTCFADKPLLLDIVKALHDIDHQASERDRKRARHRAMDYYVKDGRLWKVTNGRSIRGITRMECISREEAFELAKHEHTTNGHWGCDLIKLRLLDPVWSPGLDQSIVKAIHQCPQCKNFGPSQLHTLMYPITRRHPFKLLVVDYLSLSKGKGGYHTVLLIMDTFSQYIWGFKLKHHGMAKHTINGLQSITHTFRAPETLMTDGGSHFNNGDVRTWCKANGTGHHVVAAYAPWINGLVENANGQLLGRLKCLCSPELGEDTASDTKPEDITRAWPDHFDNAIRQLNEHIILVFRFSPKELLLGLVVNTTLTPLSTAITEPSNSEVDVQMAYVNQQCLDTADRTALHATKRKAAFDRIVKQSKAGEVICIRKRSASAGIQQSPGQYHVNIMQTTPTMVCTTPCRRVHQKLVPSRDTGRIPHGRTRTRTAAPQIHTQDGNSIGGTGRTENGGTRRSGGRAG